MYRKGDGQPAKLCHRGHAITENRNGLIMAVTVTEANGRAEPAAAVALLDELREGHRIRAKTDGEDRRYDSGPHLLELEQRGITPHVAMLNKTRDPATVSPCQWEPFAARVRMRQRQKTPEYALSQKCRKRVEECFGWMKTVGGLARTRLVGRWKLQQQMHWAASAFNLIRMRNLLAT